MPGSGKSYIGKKIAERLNYKLLEMDAILEAEFGLPLEKILLSLGDNDFLNKQAQDIIAYTQAENNIVISPGGSIVYSDIAMEHLNKISQVVYLKASFETIKRRIAETPRGIVGLKNKSLDVIYNERCKLYEKWSSVIVNADQDSEKVIQDILASMPDIKH